jgi:hypothetical protein
VAGLGPVIQASERVAGIPDDRDAKQTLDCFAEFTPVSEPGLAMADIDFARFLRPPPRSRLNQPALAFQKGAIAAPAYGILKREPIRRFRIILGEWRK